MTVCCVFSLESPHCGNFSIVIKITRNYQKYNNVCSYVFMCVCGGGGVDGGGGGGLKNEFEIAVVNEPSVFEPQKLYSISNSRN